MKTQNAGMVRGLAILAVLFTTSAAFGFYDPSVQRWVNRDPLPDAGFQSLLLEDPEQSVRLGNAFAFVGNNAVGSVDAFGLIVFQGCTEKKKKSIEDTIKNKCKAAEACVKKCKNPAAAPTIGNVCSGGAGLTINCVDGDFTFRDGTTCKTLCGKGGKTGGKSELFLCPGAWDPATCGGLECTIFHEDLHTGGLEHGDDMTAFDKCMGCKPTLPKPTKPK